MLFFIYPRCTIIISSRKNTGEEKMSDVHIIKKNLDQVKRDLNKAQSTALPNQRRIEDLKRQKSHLSSVLQDAQRKKRDREHRHRRGRHT